MLQLHKVTEVSTAEMPEIMGALPNPAEQTCTYHQVVLLNKVNSVASDALENQRRRGLFNEATMELQRHQRHSHEHLQEYQQGVRRHFVVQQVASGDEVEILRHEWSQSLAEGSQYQNLYTTSRSGASESSSDIQQSRHERDHLAAHCRNFETDTLACQSAVRSLEAQMVKIRRLRRMLEVKRKSDYFAGRSHSP